MANQLSNDAKRVSQIVDEIEDYNQTISDLEYQICDVPDEELDEDRDNLKDEQKRLQSLVNTMTNDLKFDDQVEIEYDRATIQVKRNGVLWLTYHEGMEWIEHQSSDLRNQRVAFLTGFQWDGMSNELLDEVMAFMESHGFDAVK